MFRLALVAALAVLPMFAQIPTREAWAVDRVGAIYRLSGGQWTVIPGVLKQVSVGQDGAVWGVNPGDSIYRRQGDGWVQVEGQLMQVSVGNAQNVWGVNAIGAIYQRVGDGWAQISLPKAARHICAASDGTVWAVDVDYGLWIRTGTTWRNVGGQVQRIVVGSATRIWGVNATQNAFRFNPANESWDQLPGTINQATMSADGEVWGLTNADELMRWDGSGWASLGRFFMQVSVGSAESRRAEEDNAAVTFAGSWIRQPDNAASGGFLMTSSRAGDSVTYRFNGDSLALYRRLTADGGEATVTVDGAAWGRWSFKFDQTRSQIPAVLDRLGAGPHTIVISPAAPLAGGAVGTVTVDAFEFPAPFVPNAKQQEGLAVINLIRAQAGVPLAGLSTPLNLASQSHAEYAAQPGFTCCHFQPAGTPGAIGVRPRDRAAYFGYDRGGAESVLGGCGETQDEGRPAWLSSVYHRILYLQYVALDVGCGSATNGLSVANFGTRRAQQPPARLLITWPPDQGTGIPIQLFSAGSNPPLPDLSKAGFPIALAIQAPGTATRGTSTLPFSATLNDSRNQPVPFTALNSVTDPANLSGGNDFIIVPNQFLTPATTYRVTMAGTDSDGNEFQKAWSFTTFPASTVVQSVAFPLLTGDAQVDWNTAGPVASTQLRYGPTPAYGLTATPAAAPPNTTSFGVTLAGLAPGTYHYSITATDAAGVVTNTPNRTFTLVGPRPPAAPSPADQPVH